MRYSPVRPRTWRLTILCLTILGGLVAMHGLATSGGVSACFGDPRLTAASTDSPGTTVVSPLPGSPADPAQHTGSEPVADSSGTACVATIPRAAGVTDPVAVGLVALLALCLVVGGGTVQGFGRWVRWRSPPASGVEILQLKCVLRT